MSNNKYDLLEKNQELEKKLAAIYSSRSWKISAPLRIVVKSFTQKEYFKNGSKKYLNRMRVKISNTGKAVLFPVFARIPFLKKKMELVPPSQVVLDTQSDSRPQDKEVLTYSQLSPSAKQIFHILNDQ